MQQESGGLRTSATRRPGTAGAGTSCVVRKVGAPECPGLHSGGGGGGVQVGQTGSGRSDPPRGKTNSTKVRITGAGAIQIYEQGIIGITGRHVTLTLFMGLHRPDNRGTFIVESLAVPRIRPLRSRMMRYGYFISPTGLPHIPCHASPPPVTAPYTFLTSLSDPYMLPYLPLHCVTLPV
ncbi:hypothetical protein E2C01_004717 [Portunus trituberculatus]|uniref:Uncharacterized protein n=1 Tax=Portunus trituberculatus TaxID=210409 RepID=A0A5B7CRG3_PORTR|nr:hypothetical protein [Portunus trituberculatus]